MAGSRLHDISQFRDGCLGHAVVRNDGLLRVNWANSGGLDVLKTKEWLIGPCSSISLLHGLSYWCVLEPLRFASPHFSCLDEVLVVKRIILDTFSPIQSLLGWFDLASDQIHQFVSSIWPKLFENLFSFVIRTVRIVKNILDSSLFSHYVVLLHHHVFQFLGHVSLIFCFMLIQFSGQFFSMAHIDLSNSPLLMLRSFLAMNIWPYVYLRSILEPNGVVVIFDELALHPQNFYLIQFWNIIANFVSLLQAILLFIVLYQIFL